METNTETRSNLDQLATLVREAIELQGKASFLAGRYSAGAGAEDDYARVDEATDLAAAKAVEAWSAFYAHAGDHGAALIELDQLRAIRARIDVVLPAKAGQL